MNNTREPTKEPDMLMNALGNGPTYNVRKYITAGEGPRDYWNHNPGFERALVKEEGPLPIQGNIGVIVANEAFDQFSLCSPKVDNNVIPNIGSSPNCSGYFVPDLYTTENTCGAECRMKYPESYGGKDFGYPDNMPWTEKVSNSHQLHATKNIRAGMPGQGPANTLGCYEWVPFVSPDTNANSCVLNQKPIFAQVGEWDKLPEYKNITTVKYSPWNGK